jgi:hypothetical protein
MSTFDDSEVFGISTVLLECTVTPGVAPLDFV